MEAAIDTSVSGTREPEIPLAVSSVQFSVNVAERLQSGLGVIDECLTV